MLRINDKEIYLTKGDTLDLLLEIYLEDGTPYEIQGSDVIRFVLKQSYEDEEVLIEKIIDHETLNLRLEAEETKMLEADNKPYVFDIELRKADGTVDTFIDQGELHITREVD